MSEPILTATGAYHLDDQGDSIYGQAADDPIQPASTTKVMAFAAARRYVTDAMLDTTVEVVSES